MLALGPLGSVSRSSGERGSAGTGEWREAGEDGLSSPWFAEPSDPEGKRLVPGSWKRRAGRGLSPAVAPSPGLEVQDGGGVCCGPRFARALLTLTHKLFNCSAPFSRAPGLRPSGPPALTPGRGDRVRSCCRLPVRFRVPERPANPPRAPPARCQPDVSGPAGGRGAREHFLVTSWPQVFVSLARPGSHFIQSRPPALNSGPVQWRLSCSSRASVLQRAEYLQAPGLLSSLLQVL